MIKHIGTVTLALAALTLVLHLVESYLGLPEKPITFGLAVTAACFFVYSALALTIFGRLLRTVSSMLTTFHLVNNVVRIILAAALVMLYGTFVGEGMMIFVVNLLLYYIVTVVLVSRACIKADQIF